MASTKLQYADAVHLDEERDVVWSHLLDDEGERVMIVEMSREFLEDKHGTRWGDKRAVEASFREHRAEYLAAGAAALKRGERRLKIYNSTT
jgi:hypothetical protein